MILPASVYPSQEVKLLSFQDLNSPENLEEYHNQPIMIRGFLYRAQDDRWILASEPNLPSCCAGSQRKVKKQIVLSGQFEEVNMQYPITIEGRFSIEPVWKDDQLVELFRLKEAKIVTVKDKKRSKSSIPIVGLSLGAVLVFFYFRRKGRK